MASFQSRDAGPIDLLQMRGALLVALVLMATVLVFWPTFRTLVTGDMGDGTITHRVFAIPLFLFMLWELRYSLASTPARPYWFGLFGLLSVAVAWFVGELAYIRILSEVAVIGMVPFSVLTIFGFRWLWILCFPMFYLVFAIPFRGPLVALQVDWTASFSFAALRATGIPVLREGPYFELPTGSWFVAEACSGIEYLSACVMLTVFFAWSMYSSLRKRLLFVAGGIVVGVCGNWLRAYLTMAIAHFSDNQFLRDGHGTFGWVLFAFLLFTFCLFGWRFRDSPSKNSAPATTDADSQEKAVKGTALILILPFISVLSILLASKFALHAYSTIPSGGSIEIADVRPAGEWKSSKAASVDWAPTLVNPTAARVQSFDKMGRRVDLFVGIFSNQTWNSKLVSSVNQFAAPESHQWNVIDRGETKSPYLGQPLIVKTGVIRGEQIKINARQWYWIDGAVTANDLEAKLIQLKKRLEGQPDVSAWVAIYAPVDSSSNENAGVLDEFVRDMAPSIESSLRESIGRE